MPSPLFRPNYNVSNKHVLTSLLFCFDQHKQRIDKLIVLFCLGEHKEPDVPRDWLDMVSPCVKKMRSQVQEELKASIQYLAMAAHFSRDTINRPGFAKMFFDAASEEREHAIKLISYLLMRGELTSDVSTLLKTTVRAIYYFFCMSMGFFNVVFILDRSRKNRMD